MVLWKWTLALSLKWNLARTSTAPISVFCHLLMNSAWLQPVVWRKHVCEGRRINNQTFLVCCHFQRVNMQPFHSSLRAVLLGQESLFLKSFARGGRRALQWWERSYRSTATVLPWSHAKFVSSTASFSPFCLFWDGLWDTRCARQENSGTRSSSSSLVPSLPFPLT